MFNDKTNKFEIVTKNDLLFEILHERGCDIRVFMDTFENDIKPGIKQKTTKFIDRLETDKIYNKKKGSELKVLIYNETKDIDINKSKNISYLKH